MHPKVLEITSAWLSGCWSISIIAHAEAEAQPVPEHGAGTGVKLTPRRLPRPLKAATIAHLLHHPVHAWRSLVSRPIGEVLAEASTADRGGGDCWYFTRTPLRSVDVKHRTGFPQRYAGENQHGRRSLCEKLAKLSIWYACMSTRTRTLTM